MRNLLLLSLLLSACADKHALQVSVTCKYPDYPSLDQGTHGRVQSAENFHEDRVVETLALMGDIWLLPDGGVEIR